ncbi:LacI family DNA-binding transcriptional regulator [Sphaerotilus mobilis]|uniref:LacI family transcriptional regulator n=1 Tax=Sphaerotilus mobilis TaxID=47994 RepID=A0A4V2EW45_9BURK|nr:LacI family DNA-binding transcriptional regulator [Sphaerotilus mobilis]RZS54710.1 LacI family transcriptional regulator [Sphaerotilus mobilis]
MPSRAPKSSTTKATSVPDAADAAPARTRLTLSDVAAELGVSRATVSNAFNRPDQLSANLRDEILTRSRALGYFGPDPAARALRRQSLREVAVVYHHGLSFALNDPLSVQFLQGVGAELDARGLSLQLIPKLGRDLELSAAFHTTADALIVHAEIGPELAPEVLAARKRLVLVDTLVDGVAAVGVEDRKGSAMAMAHALSRQPDRLIALCFTLNEVQRTQVFRGGRTLPPRSPSVAVERRTGMVQAALSAGWTAGRIDWLEVEDRHPESASARLAELRSSMAPGTRLAVVAMTDRMALAALVELATWKEIEVVAVVGFDDVPAAAAGLTTVRQDAHRKGELAVQTVLDGLPSSDLPVELVVRRT